MPVPGTQEQIVSSVKVTVLSPGPERPELRFDRSNFDCGLRAEREARFADVDAIPKRARVGHGESFGEHQRIWDQPSQRLIGAQRRKKEWTNFADAATLALVSERHRKVLSMFYWEGLEVDEIALRIGAKVTYKAGKVWNNDVWVILLRARKELVKVATSRNAAASLRVS